MKVHTPTMRHAPESVERAVREKGAIEIATLLELLRLLPLKTDYPHHIEVAITVGSLVKTLDNEEDARETVRRLTAGPDRVR